MQTFLLAFFLTLISIAMEIENEDDKNLPTLAVFSGIENPSLPWIKLESYQQAFFNVYKMTVKKKLRLSLNPDCFLVVEPVSDNQYDLHKVLDKGLAFLRTIEPDQLDHLDKIKRNADKKKDEIIKGPDDKWIYRFENNDENNSKIVSFDDRRLVFNQKSSGVEISNSQGRILKQFHLARSGYDHLDVTIFSNGDFALLDHISDSKSILYYGKNLQPLREQYDLVMRAQKSRNFDQINDHTFSWEVFQKFFIPMKVSKPQPLPETLIGIAEADIFIFEGTILYHIGKHMRNNGDQHIWSMIKKRELFEDIRKFENRMRTRPNKKDNNDLFKAVAAYNIDAIDKLLEKGINLSELINEEGLTPSQYALKYGQRALSFALLDNIYWYIFDKSKLSSEGKLVRNLECDQKIYQKTIARPNEEMRKISEKMDAIRGTLIAGFTNKIDDETFTFDVLQEFLRGSAEDKERFKGTIFYWVKSHGWDETKWLLIETPKLLEYIKDIVPNELHYYYLLAKSWQPIADNNDVQSLFQKISEKTDIVALDDLIKKGIDLKTVQNESGFTPSQYARKHKKKKLANALKNNNNWYAFKNKKNNQKLFEAVDQCDIAAIDGLVKCGVSLIRSKNRRGLTASQCAQQNSVLQFALFDDLCWYIIKKDKLSEECELERNLALIRAPKFSDRANAILIDDETFSFEALRRILKNLAQGSFSMEERFRGTIFLEIKDQIQELDKEKWSMLEKHKLFESPSKINIYLTTEKITNKKRQELFNAVKQYDVNAIDELVIYFNLTTLKNDKELTLSQYALKHGHKDLAFALTNNFFWYIFKKEKLINECSQKKESSSHVTTPLRSQSYKPNSAPPIIEEKISLNKTAPQHPITDLQSRNVSTKIPFHEATFGKRVLSTKSAGPNIKKTRLSENNLKN